MMRLSASARIEVSELHCINVVLPGCGKLADSLRYGDGNMVVAWAREAIIAACRITSVLVFDGVATLGSA